MTSTQKLIIMSLSKNTPKERNRLATQLRFELFFFLRLLKKKLLFENGSFQIKAQTPKNNP